jgi:hypothetical protein
MNKLIGRPKTDFGRCLRRHSTGFVNNFTTASSCAFASRFIAQGIMAEAIHQVETPLQAKVRERPSRAQSIVCLINNRTFRDPVKTPCCGTADNLVID